MQELQDNGLLHYFRPEYHVQLNQDLNEEFIEIIVNPPPSWRVNLQNRSEKFLVYFEKMDRELERFLIASGKAERREDGWVSMDRADALAYMSLLAKYMADHLSDQDNDITPGTDFRLYRDLILKKRENSQELPALSCILHNLLPMPRPDVSLRKIIKFKRQREVELLEFRRIILRFQDDIKAVRDEADLREHSQRFSEELRLGVRNLDRLLTAERIPVVLGGIETVFKIQSVPLLANIASFGEIPVEVTNASMAILGSISLGKYILDAINERRQRLAANSFSYLYSARQAGIIDRSRFWTNR